MHHKSRRVPSNAILMVGGSSAITANDLKFYNGELKYAAEPGNFKIFIGPNSRDVKEADFKLQ